MFAPPPTPAIAAAAVVDSIGVNTHIDFRKFGYQNLPNVEAAIRYLGIRNIRDSAAQAGDVVTWAQVARATGARFDDFIGETGPRDMQVQLTFVPALVRAGLLNYLEGGNEEDDPYARKLGNDLRITARFQHRVYAVGHSLGVPVINMSFGQGWSPLNDWHGDYDKVGDLSAVADFANAHTYPTGHQTTETAIRLLNADAHIAAPGRPVITTEIGWDRDGAEAPNVLQAVLDGIRLGDVKMYFYALFNDSSGKFGLMNTDATPKPAGRALHDFTTLLADPGGHAVPAGRSEPAQAEPAQAEPAQAGPAQAGPAGHAAAGALRFALEGQRDADRTLLMRKSDGSFWLALWDESAGRHDVTLRLADPAAQIQAFDPVAGTAPVAAAAHSDRLTVHLGHDPLLIRIVPDPAKGRD